MLALLTIVLLALLTIVLLALLTIVLLALLTILLATQTVHTGLRGRRVQTAGKGAPSAPRRQRTSDVRHGFFVCVTWLIHMCGIAHSYM